MGNSDIAALWPGRFPTVKQLEATSPLDVYLHGATFYMAWWLLHSLWLLSVGVHCPQQGYNTVFDGLYRKMNLNKKFSKAFGLSSIRSHAAIYLAIHAIASNVTLCWSALCFHRPFVHLGFGIL